MNVRTLTNLTLRTPVHSHAHAYTHKSTQPPKTKARCMKVPRASELVGQLSFMYLNLAQVQFIIFQPSKAGAGC